MHLGAKRQTDSGAVPLHNAVLCIECECVTSGLSDECLVCGSRSLFSLARMLGGTQLSSSARHAQRAENVVQFDAEIVIDLKQMKPKDLNATIEGITTLLAPTIARSQARFHIDVVPASGSKNCDELRAA